MVFIVENADFVIFNENDSAGSYSLLSLEVSGFLALFKIGMFGVVLTFYVTALHCKFSLLFLCFPQVE